jgi:gliding motility-associated-like protein
MKEVMPIVMVAISLISTCTRAADDAAVIPGSTTHGCLTIPSSISLNDDCYHCQRFNISCSCALEFFSMEIYDRWGVKVFGTYDIHKQWDGSRGSAYLPVGCYAYTILYRQAADSALQWYKGTVLFFH